MAEGEISIFMKTEDAVFRISCLMFAIILFGDAVLTTFNPDGMMLSPNDVKGIAGFAFLLTAIWIFIKSAKKNKTKNPPLFWGSR